MVGAHSGNSDPNVAHACVRRDKLTKIVSPTSSCAKGERSKHWSIKGPAGPQGPQGPAGPSGEYVLYDGNTRIGPALEVSSTSVLVFHEKLGVELRVSPNGQVFATGGSYNLWYLEANCAGTAMSSKTISLRIGFYLLLTFKGAVGIHSAQKKCIRNQYRFPMETAV